MNYHDQYKSGHNLICHYCKKSVKASKSMSGIHAACREKNRQRLNLGYSHGTPATGIKSIDLTWRKFQ